MKKILGFIIALIVSGAVIYEVYRLAKTVSYSVFYEDMVIETIHETVKADYLK